MPEGGLIVIVVEDLMKAVSCARASSGLDWEGSISLRDQMGKPGGRKKSAS